MKQLQGHLRTSLSVDVVAQHLEAALHKGLVNSQLCTEQEWSGAKHKRQQQQQAQPQGLQVAMYELAFQVDMSCLLGAIILVAQGLQSGMNAALQCWTSLGEEWLASGAECHSRVELPALDGLSMEEGIAPSEALQLVAQLGWLLHCRSKVSIVYDCLE